jgi:hypothetical protein
LKTSDCSIFSAVRLQAYWNRSYERKILVVVFRWSWRYERNNENHQREKAFDWGISVQSCAMPMNGRSSLNPNRRCLLQSKEKWCPPPTEFVNINTDAAISGVSRVARQGTVCRDAVKEVFCRR